MLLQVRARCTPIKPLHLHSTTTTPHSSPPVRIPVTSSPPPTLPLHSCPPPQEKDEDRARDLSELLYETALITSGFQVDSPKDYASKVFTLMKIALGYDILSEAEEQAAAAAPQAAEAAAAPKAAEAAAVPKVEATPVDAEVVSDDPWKKSA